MKRSFCLALLAALALAAAAPARAFLVRVESLEVYNSGEISLAAEGLRSMLASRIAGEGYEVSTVDPAAEGARFRLRTTVTRLGQVVSVDVSLEPLVPGAAGLRTYETVPGPEDLPKALDKISQRVRARLASQASAPASAPGALPTAAAPALPIVPVVPVVPAAPQALTPLPALNPLPAAPAAPAQMLQRYELRGKVAGEATSFAVADADGDGQAEILMLIADQVVALRESPAGVVEAWRRTVDKRFNPRFLTAADTDRDGTAEIFLLGDSNFDAFTTAYQWSAGELAQRGSPVRAYLRPVAHPDLGTVLVGTPSQGDVQVFKPELRRYAWNGQNYAPGEEIAIPKGMVPVNLDWARFTPGGGINVLELDTDNRLRIYDPEGGQLFRSEALLKGTRVRLEGAMRDVRNEERGALWEIDPASTVAALPDATACVIVHDNIEESSFYPRRWGSYDQGRLMAFRWDGLSLQTLGQSPQFQGYFLGTAPAPQAQGGKARLYALLVKSDGYLVKDYTTNVLAFDL